MTDKDALEEIEARLVAANAVFRGFKAYCEWLPIIGHEGAHCMFDSTASGYIRSHDLNRPASDPEATHAIAVSAAVGRCAKEVENLREASDYDG